MSYYNTSAILTSAQKVPCTFSIPVPGLGFLDDNPGGDVSPSTPLPLPLHLADLLALQRFSPHSPPLLSMDLPPSLSSRVLNALKADPLSVDLRALETNFFEGAASILAVLEEEEVGEVVAETFRKRAKEIADFAYQGRSVMGVSGRGGSGGEEFLRGLEEWERGLFRAAFEGARGTRGWMGEVRRGK